MRIKITWLLILLNFFFGCNYIDQSIKDQKIETEQNLEKVSNFENSEKIDFLNLSSDTKTEKAKMQDKDEIDPSKKVDAIKESPEVNITEEQTKTKVKEISNDGVTRGIYLTAYKTASADFEDILDQADSAKINTIVFDLKNIAGDVFYGTAQNRFLTPENIKPVVDIASVVKTLHGRNMKAVSRLVMFHDSFNAVKDSTLRPMISKDSVWVESKRRGPCWLDSSHPEVQNYLLGLIEEVASSGVDEIQLDYIRFPTQGNAEKAIFYFQKEDSLKSIQDSTYVKRTKADIITDFLQRAKRICDKNNVTLAADVFAIVAWQQKADIASTGQDIEMMTQHLDYIHPMIYSSHFADDFGYRKNVSNEPYYLLYKGTKLTEKYSNSSCKVVPYIQSNAWKVNYEKEYVIAQVRAIEELKSGGYILWNSASSYKKTLTWLQEYYKTD